MTTESNYMAEEEDDVISLNESFFINDNYELTTFSFGSHVFQLYCLQSASTDFDFTGQLVWPGAYLLNGYLPKIADFLKGKSVIELGSGVGITGILCSRFCSKVVLTDHNDEVLKILQRNVDLCGLDVDSELRAEKLEWGNMEHLDYILKENPQGFDVVIGADICYQQSNIPLLFDTVKHLLLQGGGGGGGVGRRECKFILAYVSRAKVMDVLFASEAVLHGLHVAEIDGTRTVVKNLGGVIYEITL